MPIVNFDNMDAVPEAFRSEAKEVDGKVQVDLVSSTKLTEFRDNNVKLMKEREDLTNVVGRVRSIFGQEEGALNLDEIHGKVKDWQSIEQKVEDKTLITDTSLEAAVATRTAEMRQKLEGQLSEAQKQVKEKESVLAKERSSRAEMLLNHAITSAVIHPESKVNASALPDILNRAKGVFSVDLDKNVITPMKGDQILYGPEGDKPMNPSEWLDTLISDAPHFAKGSTGGGSNSGGQQTAERKFGGDIGSYREQRRKELAAEYSTNR